jgi:hypothetical protein
MMEEVGTYERGSGMIRRFDISLFACSSTSGSTSKAPTATSKATSASEHHLHHLCKLSDLSLLASAATVSHARLVLSFLNYGDLPPLKQALIVHLGLHDRVFLNELDVSESLGLPCHLVHGDSHSIDFSAVAEMLFEIVQCRAEVHVLHKNRSLIRIVSWSPRGASLILIYT